MTLKKLLLKFTVTRSVIITISISLICSLLISNIMSTDFLRIFIIIGSSSALLVVISSYIIWIFIKNNLGIIENKLSMFYENIEQQNDSNDYLTGFKEIDDIFEAFKNNRRLFTLDFKNSVSGSIIGIFEFNYNRNVLIISKSISFLFNVGDYRQHDDVIIISLDKYNDYIKTYKKSLHTSESNLYYYDSPNGRQWYNIYENECRPISFGFVVDATERIKNYYNAGNCDDETLYSYDVMTDKISSEPLAEDECSCIMSIELNSLKKVNDFYGYRTGNDFLKECERWIFSVFSGCFIGKKSSFEYIIYLKHTDEGELEEKIKDSFKRLSENSFNAPDGQKIKYSFNGGYSIMPYDTNDFQTLLRYSNYALYESKNKYKGSLQRFGLEGYSHNIYVQKKVESFRNLIDNNELEYIFQPMVNLSNGDVFAYEALMRPKSRMFASPLEVLEIARQENMLYLLEKLTVKNCLEIVKENKELFSDKRLFYNTASTQILTKEDSAFFEKHYADVGYILIPEVSEIYNEIDILQKCGAIKDNSSEVAIDKYTGHNSYFENILKIKPSYIKFDRSIIQDISTNKDNQAFIFSFAKYAKKNHICVCAVGIETYTELKEAIRLGIDYAQGYYFGVPTNKFVSEISPAIVKEIKELNNQKFF